jgi:hypothetical protein
MKMKKLLMVLSVLVIGTSVWASGWDNYNGLSSNPILNGYYTNMYSNTIRAISGGAVTFNDSLTIANTKVLKSSCAMIDTVKGNGSTYISLVSVYGINVTGSEGIYSRALRGGSGITNWDILSSISNSWINLYGSVGKRFMINLGCGDTTKGFIVDSLPGGTWRLRGKSVGSTITSDTMKPGIIAMAKDTSLEVLTFTRTCATDTCAFMTGADTLTAAYIVCPLPTRGTPVGFMPFISGTAGGKLTVLRPIADTAKYDRVSITKIKQR